MFALQPAIEKSLSKLLVTGQRKERERERERGRNFLFRETGRGSRRWRSCNGRNPWSTVFLLPAEEIPASLELAFLTLGINVSTRSIRLARDLSRSLTGPLPLTPPPSGSTWTQRYPRTSPSRLIYYHTRRYNVDAKFSISKFSSLSLSLFLSLNVRSPRRKWPVAGSYMGRGTRVEETRHGFT